jgi:hypothetical protein
MEKRTELMIIQCRWPDLVLARMQQNPATNDISVLNQAAGGNRVLYDGLGPNALGRIDRDVFSHSGSTFKPSSFPPLCYVLKDSEIMQWPRPMFPEETHCNLSYFIRSQNYVETPY